MSGVSGALRSAGTRAGGFVRRGVVLAGAAGAALPFAFAPFDFYLLAPLAAAVLFALWEVSPPAAAARQGFVFGLGMFGIGVSWVHVSIHEFGHTGLAVSVPLTVLFIAAMALFPAVTGYVIARAFPQPGWAKRILALPAAWVVAEWVRGWFLTGFPWLALGYSQIDTPLAGYAPLVGVYGTSWVTALAAGLLLNTIRCAGRWRSVSIVGAAVVVGLGYGLGSVAWTRPDGSPLRVSLVQGNVSQHLKWRRDTQASTLALYRDLTRPHWDSALVVWPETAVPAFHHQVRDGYLADVRTEALRHASDLITGIPVVDPTTRRYHNSLLALGSGTIYHKRHLVPFGEYVPLAPLLRGLIGFFDLPMSDFAPGRGRPIIEAAGRKIGASICYEVAFGEEIIDALPEASLLVNVSNDAWFGHSLAPHQHLQIARMRALESGRPLLRATNTGVSALIDAVGRVQAASPQFTPNVVSGDVQPMQGATPYVRVGNVPVLVLSAVLLGMARTRRLRAGTSVAPG